MERAWHIAPRVHTDIVAQMLHNRGVPIDDVDRFLLPDWERDTFASSMFTRMPEAVALLFSCLEKGERITIHGDYDADGVSGSSLLFLAIQEIAAKFGFTCNLGVFLPDRERDGYGVALHTIERVASEGTKLLVTVDCGIANGKELGRAHELGMRTIVCDHHQMGEYYPEHAVVLHPLAPGETYPNKTLCGTGVAFKFASGLIDEARRRGADLPDGFEKWFLDFVAIATVTDVMPLVGENRVLEKFGLKVLNKTRRPGIRAILETSGTELGTIDTQAIGFRIGPRLNAAGRLASAEIAFRTLTAPTPEEAMIAAAELERLNRQRQEVFKDAYVEAKKIAETQVGASVLVVHSESWLPGIVGLIAGRLVGDYGVPAFALTKVGEHYVGSGRSVGGLHLVEAMNACGDVFVKKGGHPQACGLTIKSEGHVHEFRQRVNEYAKAYFGEGGIVPTLTIDAELTYPDVTWDLVERVSSCEPFGEGNRPPIFALTGMAVMAAEKMGSTGSHLRLTALAPQGGIAKFVGFGFGDMARTLRMGDIIDAAVELGVNEWNGRREIQMRIVDLKYAQESTNVR